MVSINRWPPGESPLMMMIIIIRGNLIVKHILGHRILYLNGLKMASKKLQMLRGSQVTKKTKLTPDWNYHYHLSKTIILLIM